MVTVERPLAMSSESSIPRVYNERTGGSKSGPHCPVTTRRRLYQYHCGRILDTIFRASRRIGLGRPCRLTRGTPRGRALPHSRPRAPHAKVSEQSANYAFRRGNGPRVQLRGGSQARPRRGRISGHLGGVSLGVCRADAIGSRRCASAPDPRRRFLAPLASSSISRSPRPRSGSSVRPFVPSSRARASGIPHSPRTHDAVLTESCQMG